ncbi:MAG: ABC transporter substrate binding protein [Casimicrobiaceae bacterium]
MNQRGATRRWQSAVLAAWCLVAGPVLAQRVLVVATSDGVPYQQALAGIVKQGLPVEALQLSRDSEATLAAAMARAGRDTIIVALGVSAANVVARAAPPAAIVNCMVLGQDDGRGASGTQLVPLEVPIETHILWLKRLLPQARTVGLLFDPMHNDRRVADTAAALARAGYRAVLEPVASPSALPAALNRLTNSAEVLQAIPDTTVFAKEHSRALLLFSFRNLIPLAGPSEAWVRAGALFAVDWDYPDLGRYCVALGQRLWAGSRAPMPAPAKTRVYVNLRTAQQLRIKWDVETLRQVVPVAE